MPRPLASIHSVSNEPQAGHSVRGYQLTVVQDRHRRSSSWPRAVASQNGLVSGLTAGWGAGSGGVVMRPPGRG